MYNWFVAGAGNWSAYRRRCRRDRYRGLYNVGVAQGFAAESGRTIRRHHHPGTGRMSRVSARDLVGLRSFPHLPVR